MRKFEELETKYLREQQKALEDSIEHWEENMQLWRDNELDEIYVFSYGCALCTKNHESCKSCIISKYGEQCSHLQEWRDASQRFYTRIEPDISSHEDYIDAGKALNEFLQYLRDINVEITTELTKRKYVDDSKPVKVGDRLDIEGMTMAKTYIYAQVHKDIFLLISTKNGNRLIDEPMHEYTTTVKKIREHLNSRASYPDYKVRKIEE